MSYSFTLNFKHCSSTGNAFLLANKAADLTYVNLRELLAEEKYYIPSLRYSHKDFSEREAQNMDDAWLERLLKMHFIYWPSYKLLALSGPTWPKDVLALFKRQVYFQNSCDQDYNFSSWKGLKSPFREIVKTCQEGSLEQVTTMLNLGREEYPWEIDLGDRDDKEEALAYYRRSAAYNGIYETLRLDRWLWGHDDPAFVRFNLSALNSPEREYEASRLIRAFVTDRKTKHDYF